MTVMRPVLDFFLLAVGVVVAQNAVFTRSLGVSRLVKIVAEGSVELFKFGAMHICVQLLSSLLAYGANRLLPAGAPWRSACLPLVLVACATAAFFLVWLALRLLPGGQGLVREYLTLLPGATFNCCVIGALLLTITSGYGLAQTMAFSLGSSVGYVAAVLLVNEGQRKIQHRSLPASFRGLPVTLVYIGILALAIYGFTGHGQAI